MNNFKKYFGEALGTLAIALDFDLTEAKTDVYFKLLAGKYPEAEILMAIEQAATTCKFIPKPAELIELMTGGKGGGQDPTVAWREAIDALERHGVYRDVEFQDGAIATAIEGLGGWVALGEMTYADMTFQKTAAQFARLYSEAVRVGAHLKPGVVDGRDSIANNSHGYENQNQPVEARTLKQIAEAVRARADESRNRTAELPVPAASIEDQDAALEVIQKMAERKALQPPAPESALKQREEDAARKEVFRQEHYSERAESWQ